MEALIGSVLMNELEANNHLEEALRQQSVLARFGELALRSNDLDEILTEACRLISEALGTDLAKVMQLLEDSETLLVRAGVGWKPGVVGEVTVPISDHTSEGHALKTGDPVISPDIGSETRFKYPSFLIEHGVKAVANVLIIGGVDQPPFGILQIDSRQTRSFDDRDTAFLRSYANLLAAAVDRLRTMAETRDGQERLRLAMEAGELGSWDLDLDSGGMICSPRQDAIFGYAERLAWTFDIFLSHVLPEDREPLASALRRTVSSGADLHCEFSIRRAGDGGVRWILAQGRLVGNRNNPRTGQVTGIVADITTRKANEEALRRSNEELEARVAERTQALSEVNAKLRAEAAEREQVEAALRQSQKMEAVGQLTGGIAHDFNNMLHAIGGNLELMSRRAEQGRAEDAVGLMENARKTVERARSLTNRLLDFARQHALDPHPVEPDALIHGMVDLIRRTVGPKIVVEEQMRNGAWRVRCDPHQFESALLNLAINARDAMPDGGLLTITTREVSLSASEVVGHEGARPGNYVEITIADSGTGMDEATRMRVFEPFFTTKPPGKGTGLGLSQLYGFVRQSGGVVQLDSIPSRGTTVRLYLPRYAPVQEDGENHVNTMQASATRDVVVLLIEPETQLRIVIAETLRELRCHVLEANDGASALQAVQDDLLPVADLMVTESDLPGALDGWQVVEAARAARPALPVLFITDSTDSTFASRLTPGTAVIDKPFSLSALAAKVAMMIDAAYRR
jgi:PAS domain S-box-containing protein